MRKLLIAALVVAPFAAYGVQAVAEDAPQSGVTDNGSTDQTGAEALAKKVKPEATGEASQAAESLGGTEGTTGEAVTAEAIGGGDIAGESESGSDD